MAIGEIFGWVALGVVLVGGIYMLIRTLFFPSATKPSSGGEQNKFNAKGGNQMAYCPKCGRPVSSRDSFCKNCGERLDNRGGGRERYTQGREPQRPQKVQRPCGWCGATGKEGAPFPETCSVCNGNTYNLIPEDWPQCTRCGGTGRIRSGGIRVFTDGDIKCPKCKGKGWAPD